MDIESLSPNLNHILSMSVSYTPQGLGSLQEWFAKNVSFKDLEVTFTEKLELPVFNSIQ